MALNYSWQNFAVELITVKVSLLKDYTMYGKFYISLLHLQLLIILLNCIATPHYYLHSHLIISYPKLPYIVNKQASEYACNDNDFLQHDTYTMHKNIMNTRTIYD